MSHSAAMMNAPQRNGHVLHHKRFEALSLAQLRERPKPEAVIPGLLMADTVALLEGKDGSLKSFLALDWAHRVALGMDWLDQPVRQGRVLYLLGEGSRGLPKRADAWQLVNVGQRIDLEDDLGFVVDEMPQLWQGDAGHIVTANPGPFRLVFVDTLARAMVGADENAQKDMGLLVAGCEQLRRAYGDACVVIIHHLGVSGESRGSSALRGAVSAQLRLERSGPGNKQLTLKTLKQRDDDMLDPINLVARVVDLGTVDGDGRPETSLVLEPAASAHAPKLATKKALLERTVKTWAALLDLGGTANFSTWRDAVGGDVSAFKRSQRDLLQAGHVEKTSDGLWQLTATGVKGPEGSKQGSMSFLDPGNGGSKTGGQRGSYIGPLTPFDPEPDFAEEPGSGLDREPARADATTVCQGCGEPVAVDGLCDTCWSAVVAPGEVSSE